MPAEDTALAFNRFLVWMAQQRSAMRASATADLAKPSRSITFCLFLIYYFSLCDFILKFFPIELAIVLRYLPEAALYFFVVVLLIKQWRLVSYPLFWPLSACALTMAVSVVLNSSSKIAAIEDYRLFFRFTAFTYIAWRTTVTPLRIVQFIRGFLCLTIIQLVIGGIEFFQGEDAQAFFSPVGGLISGAPIVSLNQVYGERGWLFGTLADYNQYGNFMTMSCVLSLGLYLMKGSRRYLCLGSACALAVVFSFSRHSLLLMALALGCLFLLRSKRIGPVQFIRVLLAILILSGALIGLGMRFNQAFEERVATSITPDVLEGDPAANMRLYMMLILPPRFLGAYPLFGQGPIAPAEAVQAGETDTGTGPTLKAAPELPGIVTYFLPDVVWVMILGLYGSFGLAAFGYVLWSIGAAANKVRKESAYNEGTVLGQVCLAMIVIFATSGFFSEEMVARDCIPVFWVLAGMVFSIASKSVAHRTAGRVLA